jgi:4-hydroxymandelate oxidase
MKTTRRQALLSGAAIATAAALPFQKAMAANPEQSNSITPPADQSFADALSLSDFQEIAQKRMSHMAWEYINSGAADEITPRVLRDTTKLETRVKILGQELPFPVILAPTSLHKLAHAEGELATAKGAGQAGTTMVLSTMSSTTVEDVAKAATHPLWFQLYLQKDKGFTEHLVARAEACGCKALVVTVDTPIEGARNRESC